MDLDITDMWHILKILPFSAKKNLRLTCKYLNNLVITDKDGFMKQGVLVAKNFWYRHPDDEECFDPKVSVGDF